MKIAIIKGDAPTFVIDGHRIPMDFLRDFVLALRSAGFKVTVTEQREVEVEIAP